MPGITATTGLPGRPGTGPSGMRTRSSLSGSSSGSACSMGCGWWLIRLCPTIITCSCMHRGTGLHQRRYAGDTGLFTATGRPWSRIAPCVLRGNSEPGISAGSCGISSSFLRYGTTGAGRSGGGAPYGRTGSSIPFWRGVRPYGPAGSILSIIRSGRGWCGMPRITVFVPMGLGANQAGIRLPIPLWIWRFRCLGFIA